MSRRRAALLTLALGLVTTLPTAPGSAQEAAPARLTVTPQSIDFGSILFGVSFADSLHGHAVGAYHSIFGTADGGQTWARKDNPLPTRDPRTATAGVVDPRDQALISVSFPDPDHGFAVATDDAVLATSDGGTTWALRPTPRPASLRVAWPEDVPPSAWNFTGVSFPTATSGFVVGHLGVILATADGGTTWRYQGDPRYGVLQGVSFLDERNGHVVGRASGRADGVHYTSLVTTDGQRWDPKAAGPADEQVTTDNMSAVAVTTPAHAVTVGHGGRIFATFDGGATWRNTRSGSNERLSGVAFADDGVRGLAVGTVEFQGELRAIILATTDRGQSWTPYPAPGYGDFSSVDFADSTTAFAVGCTTNIGTCTQAAVVKIDFPPVEFLPEEAPSSELPVLALVLVGAAALVAAGGFLLARRR